MTGADRPTARRITSGDDPDLQAAANLLPERIPDALDPDDIVRWVRNDPVENVLLVAKIGTAVWGFLLFHYFVEQRTAFFAYFISNRKLKDVNGQHASEVLFEELGNQFKTDENLRDCRRFLFEVERPDPTRRDHRLQSLARINLFCQLAASQGFALKALDLEYLQPRLSLDDPKSVEKPMLLMYAYEADETDSGFVPREQVEEMLQFVYTTLYPSDFSINESDTENYRAYAAALFNRQSENLPQEVKTLDFKEIKARFMRDLVYISYSHKDKAWHERLRKVLDADPEIRDLIWDDTKIPPSAGFAREIDEHVARARIMIMLGSEDYFAPTSAQHNARRTGPQKPSTRPDASPVVPRSRFPVCEITSGAHHGRHGGWGCPLGTVDAGRAEEILTKGSQRDPTMSGNGGDEECPAQEAISGSAEKADSENRFPTGPASPR